MTDSSGQPAFEGDYKPFGEEASAIGSEKYAFTGQYNEAEIGLYYFGARWYDASLGRFISEDPIKGSMISSQSQNPYVYCMNNPLRYIDPSGMLMTDPEGNEYHDGYLQSYSGGDWIYYPESGGSCNVSGECYREDHFAPSQSPITPPANLPDCASYGGKYFRKSSYTPNSATYEGNRPSITKPGATVDPCAGFRRTDVWIPEHPPIRLTELHFTWGCLVGSADINIVYDSNNMKGYVEVGLNPGVASPNLTILPAISLNDVKLYSITEYKNADTITFGGGYQAYGEITFYNKDGDGKAEIFSHTVLGYTPSPCIAITSNKHYWEWGMDFG